MTESFGPVVNDPPTPALPDVEQRPVLAYPAVPVQVVGPVLTQSQPARTGQVTVEFLTDAGLRRVLSADPRRARAVLFSTMDWSIASRQNGLAAPVPQDFAVELLHTSEVWAQATAGETEQELTVIAEYYAQ